MVEGADEMIDSLSDEYDFNPRPSGGESSGISVAGEVAGKDEALGENAKQKQRFRFSALPDIVVDETTNSVYRPRYAT